MKKGLKGLGLSLCAMLLLAGCSCKKEETRDSVKANINNGSDNILSGLKEGTNNITLQSVYDDLKVKLGNEYAANKLLDIIASKLLNGDDWQKRYDDKMEEKLLKLVENSSYQVNGEFSEELLVKTLESQLYSITCDQTPKYGPIYEDGEKLVVDKYFQCDYTDYQEKALRMEVLTELLNEKYIYDKAFVDKSNLLDTKKTRIVEYIAISSSEEYSFEFITDAVSKLANENKTLEEIAVLWEEKLIEELEKKYNKINTKDDSTGTIYQEFTNGYKYDKEEGLRLKKQAILKEDYYKKLIVNSDNKDILNTILVDKILSENVLKEEADKTIKINGSYYLVSPLAEGTIDADDIRITDKTNSKYYLIKVDVINSSMLEDENKKDLVYDAVKLLATNKTLVSNSINYYLDQNKNEISVHDEEIYAYLKTQYKDIFVD